MHLVLLMVVIIPIELIFVFHLHQILHLTLTSFLVPSWLVYNQEVILFFVLMSLVLDYKVLKLSKTLVMAS